MQQGRKWDKTEKQKSDENQMKITQKSDETELKMWWNWDTIETQLKTVILLKFKY